MSKPSRKNPPSSQTSSQTTAPASRGKTALVLGVVAAVAVAIGAFALTRSGPTEPAAGTQAAAAPVVAPIVAPVAAAAEPAPGPAVPLKPHTTQKDYPPLQLPGYPLGRSAEVITAAYRFAAEHPEVLTYVPCFCGCERSGHKGNEDCFVKARGSNGDVTAWEPHGMECNVCIDVAQQAMQMHASGASVRDIRAAVEKKWASTAAQNHTHTPTPEPPK